jgi:outer membrane receptor protein involved in Fe transport
VGQIRNWAQNEVNFFVKDDWKVTPSLTLNLGLRYDLMRVPYIPSSDGKPFTPGIIGAARTFSDIPATALIRGCPAALRREAN